MHTVRAPVASVLAIGVVCLTLVACAQAPTPAGSAPIPRYPDGKPNFQGVWQARTTAWADLEDHPARHGLQAGLSVVKEGTIPYLPAMAERRRANAANRATADPLAKCYMPGVPRIMSMAFPFQIFQTANQVAMTFEWSQVFRLIPTDGSTPPDGLSFWMGDSRGRWEGDTLVVRVTNHTDGTWFDMAGNFHSDALTVVERYTMRDADTIDYEATMEDPGVFTKPWTIAFPLHRMPGIDRALEYQCNAEAEEARGDFERDPRTWYPGPGEAPPRPAGPAAQPSASAGTADGTILRLPDGTPDLSGYFQPDGGGANYGLEQHEVDFLTPGGRGVVEDPPDGTLPYLDWARAERKARETPERGYDDPTAHCFVAGVPRSMYTPSPLQILQPPGHVVILFERMSWRNISLTRRQHLPDHLRLWQGDSIGRWDGDTLVVETKNLNGKAWLNEVGDVVSHAEQVVERFTPRSADLVEYRATVTDPLVYARPWTILIPLRRMPEQLLEVACHEDNGDLQHLKEVRDAARAKAGRTR